MAFVCKQTAVLVVRIINNAVLTDLKPFFSLNTLPHTGTVKTAFFSFEYFDPYDHYAACWVTLKPMTDVAIKWQLLGCDLSIAGCCKQFLEFNKALATCVMYCTCNGLLAIVCLQCKFSSIGIVFTSQHMRYNYCEIP